MKKKLKFEIGKTYKTRAGEHVLLEGIDDKEYPYLFSDGYWRAADGALIAGMESPRDIIDYWLLRERAKKPVARPSAKQEPQRKLTPEEAFCVLHANCGINIGDTVHVVRKEFSMPGVGPLWADGDMDEYIGDTGKVMESDCDAFRVNLYKGYAARWFRFFCLERVATVIIESQGVAATATPDAVQVGEQTFTREQIAAFARAMDDAKGGER